MTLRHVVECERFLLRIPSHLCKRLVLGLKKVAKAKRNGLGFAKMHPFPLKIEDSYENTVLHPKLYYQRNFGVQICHKSLLFKAKHFFAK
jgi:hypothetical protein